MLQRFLVIFFLLACYLPLFLHQENLYQTTRYSLAPVLPAKLQAITFGYLKQLAAEIAFIRSAVFLGGVPAGTDPESYAGVLGHNYTEITSLYPEFIDPYYYCQSYLSYVGPEYAKVTTEVLQTGIDAMPEDIYLRFFQGFDYFHYLDDPLQAARVFKDAAEVPGAPPWYLRMSALLSVEGGNLTAGLLGMKAIRSTETDPGVQAYYDQEIESYERAIDVQNSIQAFRMRYNRNPDNLDELVPEFLEQLPEIQNYILIYDPPLLRLERPLKS